MHNGCCLAAWRCEALTFQPLKVAAGVLDFPAASVLTLPSLPLFPAGASLANRRPRTPLAGSWVRRLTLAVRTSWARPQLAALIAGEGGALSGAVLHGCSRELHLLWSAWKAGSEAWGAKYMLDLMLAAGPGGIRWEGGLQLAWWLCQSCGTYSSMKQHCAYASGRLGLRGVSSS